MKPKTRSRIIIFSALAVLGTSVIALAILCLLCGCLGLTLCPELGFLIPLPFNKDLWEAGILRPSMYNGLSRYDFTGWSKSEVLELLGEPDSVYTNEDGTSSIYYDLYGENGPYIFIVFDENDIVYFCSGLVWY